MIFLIINFENSTQKGRLKKIKIVALCINHNEWTLNDIINEQDIKRAGGMLCEMIHPQSLCSHLTKNCFADLEKGEYDWSQLF